MIGALTTTSATVWLRLDEEAHVRLRYRLKDEKQWTVVEAGDASPTRDYALKVRLQTLDASRVYAYEIGLPQSGGAETWSSPFWFKTMKARPTSVDFAVATDFALEGKESAAFAGAAATRPDFLAVIGDMDHSGPASGPDHEYYPPDEWPVVLENMRSMHRLMRDPTSPIGAQFAAGLVASSAELPQIPFYEVWDDHDYCANNSDYSCPFRKQAFQAWKEYFAWPRDSGLGNAGCGGEGVYQRFAYGAVATVFMLDARSNRAPTNDDHPATMLGECQLQWLMRGLQTTRTVWKFVLSPVTFNPGTKTWDAWSNYNAGPDSDRQRLLAAIRDHDVRNVVVISGDIHSGGAIDDGTNSGLPEVSVPHANMPVGWVNTYCRYQAQENTVISTPGTWTIGGLVDPNIGGNPPTCLRNTYAGARIGSPGTPPFPLDGRNAPGFVRVDATATGATVQIFDKDGNPRKGWRADGSTADMRIDLQAR
jgi:alkaline phosphatase D